MYAEVCFPFSITKTFSYRIPDKLKSKIKPGNFVVAQFRSKPITGLIIALSSNIKFTGKVNEIISINHNYSIPSELWETLQWMHNYYITPIGKIAQVTLSWAFKKRLVESKKIKHIKLKNLDFDNQKLTHNQQILINRLLKNNNSFTPLSDFSNQLKYPYAIYKQLKASIVLVTILVFDRSSESEAKKVKPAFGLNKRAAFSPAFMSLIDFSKYFSHFSSLLLDKFNFFNSTMEAFITDALEVSLKYSNSNTKVSFRLYIFVSEKSLNL